MSTQPKNPTSILITGASSGIGAALAVAYAAPGVTLFLSGRDQNRLSETAQVCSEKGAEIFAQTIDVTHRDAMAEWILKSDSQTPLDLVIANAGISGGSDPQNTDTTRHIFETNVDGVLNALLPIIPQMIARKHGQLALMSSLAGFRGLPSAPAYSASKAAVRSYGEALRGALHNDGIKVSVICPGFVESLITDANNFHMPFLMKALKAAETIKRGLAHNKSRIAFPFPMYAATWIMSILPSLISDTIARRLPKK